MPPAAAAAVTFCFVLLMLLLDVRREKEASSALWLPVLWFAVAGSRFVSQWLSIWGLGQSGVGETEGSLIDAVYFGILIFSAIGVLVRRQRVVDALVRNKIWVLLFFLYGCLAIVWSDFPFVAVKRWILRLGFFIAIVAYNYTEATFKGVSIVWTMFYIVAIDYPQLRKPKKTALAASVRALASPAFLFRGAECSRDWPGAESYVEYAEAKRSGNSVSSGRVRGGTSALS